MIPLTTAVARSLLADGSFDIEFHGYLSNHAKHAVIALDRLSAPAERVQEYWDAYTSVTPYNLCLHGVEKGCDTIKPLTDDDEWVALRGQKERFQEQVVYMQGKLDENNKNISKLVEQYAPDLLSGLAGALTHGIIHLGWALDANSPYMVCEGLAYLNFCHLGCDPRNLVHSKDLVEEENPMESYIRVANTIEKENLKETWVDKAKAAYNEDFHPELVSAGFQWQLSKVLHDAHPVTMRLPAWTLHDNKLEERIWEDLYKAVTWIYLSTRDCNGNGSFLALHLLTSLWGLEQVCKTVANSALTRDALGFFFANSVCLLATGGFPASEALQRIRQTVAANKNNSETDWTPMVMRAIEETEEHNIKLVYVSRELWKRFNHWTGFEEAAKSFTLTPDIGPEKPEFEISF